MKAVILAAGKGTRMRELTNDVPKPMLRVQGQPILEHILAGLKTVGVREVFIVTGWKAEVIERHFGDGAKLGVQVHYGRQVVQDGTGKAPELAKEFVGQSSFILTYGDILVKPETYQQMLRRTISAGSARADRAGRAGRCGETDRRFDEERRKTVIGRAPLSPSDPPILLNTSC
jgi:NDP-sugar pyrophosphorylase family protein